jgi:hypothetical protein
MSQKLELAGVKLIHLDNHKNGLPPCIGGVK